MGLNPGMETKALIETDWFGVSLIESVLRAFGAYLCKYILYILQ